MLDLGAAIPILGLGLMALHLWAQNRHARAQRTAWREAAERAGLSHIEVEGPLMPKLTARSGSLRVTVVEQQRKDPPRTRFEINAPGLLPERLELRAEGVETTIEKLVKGPDLATGDDAFDRRVLARGNPVLLTAVLDAPTRAAVTELALLGGHVSPDGLVVVRKLPIDPHVELERQLARLVTLVRRLACPLHPGDLLADNAVNDPIPGVRLKNVQVLSERFRDRPATRGALRACLSDRAAEVRLAAAIALGAEGNESLERLACSDDTSDHVAASALRAVGPALGSERVLAMLAEALMAPRREVALAALEVLGRLGGEAAVDRLTTVLRAADDELAATAARALGGTGAAAEPRLLEALDRGGEVATAAAEALSRAGTVAAVTPLRDAATRRGAPAVLRTAVTEAIAAIKERATGASPGQLALAGGETGQVALVEDVNTGRVTLTDGEE